MSGTTPRILPLAPEVIAQVAAGEVIERPASVVKELVENALDAGATHITIELEQAGKTSISVSDNGHGIARDDFTHLITRHATSKLREISDVWQLQTLGFRGEALASIATVATLKLQSRLANEPAGWSSTWQAGVSNRTKPIHQKPIGMAPGTKVQVTDLFAHLPGRLEFLRQDATEWRHTVETVTACALSHPSVGFHLKHNGTTYWRLPSGQTAPQRLAALMGDWHEQLKPVQKSFPHLGVEGWVGVPPAGTSRPRHQYLFVNQRPVQSPLISEVVRTALRHHLDPRSHPVFILQLQLPPETVDVNVHPRKLEVKFLNQGMVRDLVTTALEEWLQSLPQATDTTQHRRDYLITEGNTRSYAGKKLKALVLPPVDASSPEPILQMFQTYLGVVTSEGLLLLDQHAAHERILYEQFSQAFQNERHNKKHHTLAVPISWQPSTTEYSLLQEHRQQLETLGFQFEWTEGDTGSRTVVITSVPQLLQDRDPLYLLSEVLDDLAHDLAPREVDTASQMLLAYLACRSAIKAGESLTQQQRQDLIDQLAQTKTLHTCPHGRPVAHLLTQSELEKLFHRR